MKLTMTDNYTKEQETSLLHLFYKFYEYLNGIEAFRFFSKPTLSTDKSKHRFLDRIDSNLDHAIASVEQINADDNIKVITITDIMDNIIGASRILRTEDGLNVCEILSNSPYIQIEEEIIRLVIAFVEGYASEQDIHEITLEIPWYDTIYHSLAKTLGYEGPEIETIDYNRQRTFLMSKQVRKVEDERVKRVRDHKQTERLN